MVTITNYKSRENKKGEQFFVLELSGGLERIQGANGMYFTSRTCTVPTSFTESQCQSMIGLEVPGRIDKVECEPYSYLVPGTDDVKTLNYRYEYIDTSTEIVENNVIDDEAVM